MLRRLDGCNLVTQIHRLSPLGRLAPPCTQLRRSKPCNFARMGQDGTVDGDCSASDGQLRIRAKPGSCEHGRTARLDRFRPIDALGRNGHHKSVRRRFEPAPIHFVHARIHANEDPRACDSELLSDRCQIRYADSREVGAVREALSDADSNSHSRERSGPATVRETVELLQRQTRFLQHIINHRQHEVSMTAWRFRCTLDDAVVDEQRDRATLGGRIDGQQLHGATRRGACAAMPTDASFSYRNSSTSSIRSVRGIGGRLSRKIRP